MVQQEKVSRLPGAREGLLDYMMLGWKKKYPLNFFFQCYHDRILKVADPAKFLLLIKKQNLLNNPKSHPPPAKNFWKCLNTPREHFKIDITRRKFVWPIPSSQLSSYCRQLRETNIVSFYATSHDVYREKTIGLLGSPLSSHDRVFAQ